MCDRQIDVHVRLEVEPLHHEAWRGLAFNGAKVIDEETFREFRIGAQPLFGFSGIQAVIVPDDCYDWNIDGRKDVRRRAHQGGDAEQQTRIPATRKV